MTVKIVFISLFTWENQNFTVRMLHRLAELAGAKAYTIFFKRYTTNNFKQPTPHEEALFLDTIKEISPTIVSFTVLTPFVDVARHLSKKIKKELPDTKIIWGGIHPTICPEECTDDADFICCGEGEGAILDLIRLFGEGEKKFSDIKIANLNGENLRPLIEDLDTLPAPLYGSPDFYFIDNNVITRIDQALLTGNYYVQTSRGCPWHCTYCVNGLLSKKYRGFGTYVRRKSVESVILEIKEFEKIGRPRYIFFNDDLFGSDKKWLDEFCQRYKTEIKLPFFAQFLPWMLSEEILDKLVDAGLNRVCFGIQSGSEEIRNEIFSRLGSNEEIIHVSWELHKRGINTMQDLILNNPYETEMTLSQTIKLLFKLPRPLNFKLYSLQFFPKLPLTEKAIRDGYPVSVNAMAEFIYTPKIFPFDKKQMLQNVIWLIANNYIDKSTAEEATISIFTLLYLHIRSVYLHHNNRNQT